MREWQNRIVFDEKDGIPLIVIDEVKETISELSLTDYLHDVIEATKKWFGSLFDNE